MAQNVALNQSLNFQYGNIINKIVVKIKLTEVVSRKI